MKKFALLVVGLAVILSGLVFAQDSDSSQATTLGPLPSTGSLEPDATTPPAIIADFVVINATLAGTPCFNCVNGTTGGTFGLTQPVAYIATTFTSLQLVLYYQNISYMGSCKATFTIKNVSKTLLTVSKTFTKFAPNTVGFVSLGGKRPKTSGAASLAGSLKCGSNPATTATGSIYLQ